MPTANGRPKDISAKVETIRAEAKVPALAGAVIGPHGVIAIGVAGVRKQGDPTPATVEDKWHLGSDTKAMTSVLIGMLVDEGKLTWDAKLPALLPPTISFHPSFAEVTLAQLLAHRSGVGEVDAYPDIWAGMWSNQGEVTLQRAAIAATVLARQPINTPGSAYAYSNFNYIIAGAILERAGGTSWEDLMTTRLFQPLKMTSCGFGAPAALQPGGQPWGHNGQTPVGVGQPADNPPALGPAGTVHCSLADWGSFAALFFASSDHALVSKASVARIATAWPDQKYGLGWMIAQKTSKPGKVLLHTGSNTMFYCMAWIEPASNRAYLAVTNTGDGADVTDTLIASMMLAFPIADAVAAP